MKRIFSIMLVLFLAVPITACGRQDAPAASALQKQSEITSALLSSNSILASTDQLTSALTEQSSSPLKTVFFLDVPADNAVKLSFSRIGGNTAEVVDITEDIKTITTIIQKINELEFTKSRFSDKEIQMKNGASSTLRIDYRDGSSKELRDQSGWYQYTDYGEQWLEPKGSLDIEQFIADEMGVQLWRQNSLLKVNQQANSPADRVIRSAGLLACWSCFA